MNKDLLEILACPQCKGSLILKPANEALICGNCRLMYPIKDEIPIMLIEEAIRIE